MAGRERCRWAGTPSSEGPGPLAVPFQVTMMRSFWPSSLCFSALEAELQNSASTLPVNRGTLGLVLLASVSVLSSLHVATWGPWTAQVTEGRNSGPGGPFRDPQEISLPGAAGSGKESVSTINTTAQPFSKAGDVGTVWGWVAGWVGHTLVTECSRDTRPTWGAQESWTVLGVLPTEGTEVWAGGAVGQDAGPELPPCHLVRPQSLPRAEEPGILLYQGPSSKGLLVTRLLGAPLPRSTLGSDSPSFSLSRWAFSLCSLSACRVESRGKQRKKQLQEGSAKGETEADVTSAGCDRDQHTKATPTCIPAVRAVRIWQGGGSG